MLRAHVDDEGDLTAVNGYAVPRARCRPTPGSRADGRLQPVPCSGQGAAPAGATARPTPPGVKAGQLHAGGLPPRRWSRAQAATPSSSTRSRSPTSKNIRDMVFIDANTGKIVNRYSHGRRRDSTASCTRPTPQPRPHPGLEGGRPASRATSTSTSRTSSLRRRRLLVLRQRLRSRLLRRRRRHDADGQQRPGHRLPERQLERRDHQLLRRRLLRRRRGARVGPRLHRVHLRPDLPVAVGCAQRVATPTSGARPST